MADAGCKYMQQAGDTEGNDRACSSAIGVKSSDAEGT